MNHGESEGESLFPDIVYHTSVEKSSNPSPIRHSHRRNNNTMRHEHIRYADSGPQGDNETMVL